MCFSWSSLSENSKESLQFTSSILDIQFEYRVVLPDEYNEKKSYPLLVALDGQSYGELVSTNTRYMAAAGDIPEHIIVSLNVYNRLKHYTPTDSDDWFGDGGGEQFLSFINGEFLPHLKNTLPVSSNSILWGHSAAGLFAMYAFLEQSPHFNAFLVNDAPLDWDNKYINKQLKKHVKLKSNKQRFLYLNSSYLNPNVPEKFKYMPAILSLLEKGKQDNLRWYYQSFMNESHLTVPMLGFIDGMRNLYKGYRLPEQLFNKDLKAIKHHIKKHSNQIGARDSIPELAVEQLAMNQVFSMPHRAIQTLQEGLLLFPHSIPMREMLSDAFVNAKQEPKAITVLTEAIELTKESDPEQAKLLKEKLDDLRNK